MKRLVLGHRRPIGYLRVSTDEQGDSGAGLAAQRAAIEAECQRRDWELEAGLGNEGIFEDVASGRSINGRAQLRAALAALRAGQADTLVAAKLDRLSRSVVDFGNILEQARREGWSLVVLDADFDTSTAMGEAMAYVVAVFAQLERRRGSERTREGLAEKRKAGVVLGRPPLINPQTEAWVHWRHGQGASMRQIVQELQDQGQPAPRGGRWQVSTIQRILARDPARPRVSRPQRKAS